MKATIYDCSSTDIEYESPIGDMMADCYSRISSGMDTKIIIPVGLDNLFDYVEKGVGISLEREYKELDIPKIKFDTDMVIVGYSSGLDSTCQALYQRSLGKHVILFHIKHLNHSYPDEYDSALRFAKDYGFDLIVIDPKFIRQTVYIDNPIKNQTILAYMIDYGLSIGCCSYAMGNYRADRLSEQVKGYETTDSIELFDSFNEYIRSIIPEYEYQDMQFDKYDAFKFMVSHEPKALAYVNSCLRPYRFKDYTHDITVKKYGVPLIHHHCGVCYKCAMEYLILADLKYYGIDKAYAKKCISTLREKNGTTFTLNLDKSMTDKEVLEKVLNRDVVMARWNIALKN